MSYESFEEYQYNSCISRGICSINPRLSALQTVIVLYLRLFAKYAIKLDLDKSEKIFILNTISITIYNPEFNENSFLFAIDEFKKILPKMIERYHELNSESDLEDEKQKAIELFKETDDIIQALRYGEKIFNRALEKIPTEIRDLYNTMLVITKSLSINLLDLESFDKEYSEGFAIILDLLSKINLEENNVEFLKSKIIKASNIDIEIMKLIRETQEERYGKQGINEVSFSTIPNKAVLVVGSNIRELETVLEALKDEEIDVYTHDDMMLAHTFPKFLEYKNLRGQFGQGLENCLLDFATFPGPIILTKHSLHNIENFYRGILFTTDYTTSPKGIIKIENQNFEEVIKSAKESKGFKSGKHCENVTIGYNYDDIIFQINEAINSKKYKSIFIIGLDFSSIEQKTYFAKLVKLTPKDVLIISFSYESEKENLIHINTCFDSYSWLRIFDYIKEFQLPISIFVPKCDRHTVSQMIYLSNFNDVRVFVGNCTPIILNPSLMNTLRKTFSIENITSAKNDLEQIFKDKS
ncbi:hypothetical protein IJ384_03035 [bacterium]|nr:hypothetical protein [bacterium]